MSTLQANSHQLSVDKENEPPSSQTHSQQSSYSMSSKKQKLHPRPEWDENDIKSIQTLKQSAKKLKLHVDVFNQKNCDEKLQTNSFMQDSSSQRTSKAKNSLVQEYCGGFNITPKFDAISNPFISSIANQSVPSNNQNPAVDVNGQTCLEADENLSGIDQIEKRLSKIKLHNAMDNQDPYEERKVTQQDQQVEIKSSLDESEKSKSRLIQRNHKKEQMMTPKAITTNHNPSEVTTPYITCNNTLDEFKTDSDKKENVSSPNEFEEEDDDCGDEDDNEAEDEDVDDDEEVSDLEDEDVDELLKDAQNEDQPGDDDFNLRDYLRFKRQLEAEEEQKKRGQMRIKTDSKLTVTGVKRSSDDKFYENFKNGIFKSDRSSIDSEDDESDDDEDCYDDIAAAKFGQK
eukprot:403371356